ncbi:hypothetical protein ACIQYG_22825 [Peribacillus sp. NPDC096622]|uniref:hypothetical protein n=1 Tax=Peribacillus sp. NPDC096622 TaxID=3364396 RepID=UPI00380D2F60
MITPTCWLADRERRHVGISRYRINRGRWQRNFHWDEVAKNPEGDHEPIVPIESYLENTTQLVKQIQDKHVTPYLLTLPPLDPARYYRSIADKFGHSIGHFVSHVGGIEH